MSWGLSIQPVSTKKLKKNLQLGSYKLDAAGKFGTIGIPPRAVIEIDRTGKLKAKKNGFNIIRAVHTMPNGDVKYSNYALVIVGIGSIAAIEIQPRSFSFLRTSGRPKTLVNLIYERLAKKLEEHRESAQPAGGKQSGGNAQEAKKLAEFNIPMILSLSGPWANPNDSTSYLKTWGPYLTNWIGHTGFAELVSV